MKLKTKLVSLCLAFAMVVGVLMVGVYAVKKTNFTLGGNISFSATGINATISAGTMAGGNWVTADDASTKMKSVEINTNKTESQIQNEFASWSGLNFTFNEAADDVTITFTITNNSKTANDYVVAYVNVNNGTAKNAYATVTNAGAVINPDTTDETENVETFVVTFKVLEKDTNASLEGFSIEFDLRQGPVTAESSTDTTLTYENITYTIGENNTLSLTSYIGSPTDVVVPAYIRNGETIYTVTSIGEEAFMNYGDLTSITIPDSVTTIESYAFESCTSLASVIIPDSVTSLGEGAFYSCSSLTSIIIPYGVADVQDYTFESCTSLASVTIPDTVTSIGEGAFSSCRALTSIDIPAGVTRIEPYTFTSCSALTRVSIPDSVTSIGTQAFEFCRSLTSITIPDSVTSIGNSAFSSCSALESITIPDSVISIGNFAFRGCSALESITIPDGVTSIGNYAFSSCSSLTSIEIPDSVTSIGSYAFSSCSALESITIPDSVTSIDSYAFSNCSALADVYYTGTEEQWAAITIGSNNTYLINATIHYESTGA